MRHQGERLQHLEAQRFAESSGARRRPTRHASPSPNSFVGGANARVEVWQSWPIAFFFSTQNGVLMSTNALTSRGFYILSLRLYPCALVSAGSEIRPPRCASPVAKRWAIMGHCDNDTPGTRYAHAATINAIQLKSSAVGSDHAVHRDPGQPHWHSRGAPAPTKAPDALQYVRRINAIPPMFGRLKAIQTRIKSLKSCTAGGPVMCAGRHVAACQ